MPDSGTLGTPPPEQGPTPPTTLPDVPAPMIPSASVTPAASDFLAALHPPVTVPDPAPPPPPAPAAGNP
ncbi:2-methylisoborneol synthase, partial [Streptomyces sp. NPDC060131]